MAAQGNSTTVANMEAQRDVRTDDDGDVIMESEQSRHSGVSLQAGDSCVTQRSTTDSLIQLLTLKEASRENEPDFLQGNSEVTIDYIASRYVHTDILQDAIEVLEDKGVVILCGPPGSGKSYHGQALLRHYRSLSYKPHMLFTFKHWHKHVGEGRKCILLMDMTFGKECVKREEHHIWDSIRSTAIALISQGHCKLVVTVYPHVLRELLQLEDDIHSPLSHSVTVSLFESLDEDKKAEVLVAHLKELHMPPDTQRQVVANVLQKDLSGPVFGWCCNWLVLNWTSVQDPTVIFTQPAEAYVPLLRRMLLHPILGNALAAVLSLVMLRHVRYLHQPQSVKEALLQLGFEPISDDRLAAVADLLKGFVLNQDADDFASRDLYDAAGLALCRSYRLPALLTACDIIFLVKHVRTVTTASVLSATVKSKEDTRLLVDKLLLHILKGQAPMICQHPDFGSETFFNLFKACCEEQKNELDKVMSVTDGQYHLPLIYWSIWNPSPRLACWCFRFFTENAKGSAELLLSTAVAALLFHHSADGRSWVKELVETRTLDQITGKNEDNITLKLPFPNIVVTEETRKMLEDFRTILLTRGTCYLGNASMPIPAELLSVRLSEQDGVVVDMSMKHVRLVLRLLTDCEVDDTDGDGNTLLHLAAAAGNLEVITLAVKSGASITLKNKAGLSPYDMGHRRRQWLKTSGKDDSNDSIETLQKSCKNNDTETVKVLLCYTVSVDECTFVLDPSPKHFVS